MASAAKPSIDFQIWRAILLATASVMLLILLLVIVAGVSPSWFLLPLSWLVGAVMTRGYSKYKGA